MSFQDQAMQVAEAAGLKHVALPEFENADGRYKLFSQALYHHRLHMFQTLYKSYFFTVQFVLFSAWAGSLKKTNKNRPVQGLQKIPSFFVCLLPIEVIIRFTRGGRREPLGGLSPPR